MKPIPWADFIAEAAICVGAISFVAIVAALVGRRCDRQRLSKMAAAETARRPKFAAPDGRAAQKGGDPTQ